MSSRSAGDKEPNENVIPLGNGAIENAEKNVEVSSRLFATHRGRKEPSIANSRSSIRRQIQAMALKNQRAKKEAEQRLQERHLELEQEREEIKLRRREKRITFATTWRWFTFATDWARARKRKEESGGWWREIAVGNWTDKKSSRATGSQADDLEGVGSGRKLERTAGWANTVAQQSGPSRQLSPNVLIDPPKNATQDRSDKRYSAYPIITLLIQLGGGFFSTQLQDSRNQKSLDQLGWQNHRCTCPRQRSSNKDLQPSQTGREARVPSTTFATDRWRAKTK